MPALYLGNTLLVPPVGTGPNTLAAGDDGRFHDSVTLGASLTDVLVVTGQALSAVSAGGDRILFFDSSASKIAYLELGTNLSITGTTLNATGGGSSTGGDLFLSANFL